LELTERIQIVLSTFIISEIAIPEGSIAITKRRRAITRGVDYKKLAGIRTNIARLPIKGSLTKAKAKAKAKARGEDMTEISE
jgi:hypothetical protein